jgi:hypothetical protein
VRAYLLEKKTRRAAAVAVFVVAGLFSSVAFGSFVAAAEPITTTTEAAATAPDATSTDNGATTTDLFSTDTTPTLTALETSTDEGTTTSPSFFPTTTTDSDSTTSPDPSLSYYLVKFTSSATEKRQEDAIAAAGATDLSRIAPLNLHSISVPIDSAQAAIDSLLASSIVVRVDSDKTREASTLSDDPQVGNQWSLPRIGWDNLYGTVPASGSATVAVLDTGVDASHEDLQGQLVAGTSILDGSAGTTDANGHGTEMAGIVAAATGNATGIAGVGYGGVKVMPVTVLGADGTGQDSDVIEGLVWAVQHNANVILMSFSNPGFSQSLQDAIDYAWANNLVVVAATGNDGSSAPQFPAGDRGVIGVSNTDSLDNLNGSSNYGDDTFLAAPGTGILTTTAGGGYSSITGTSASAAIVAGAAGLMRATSISAASNGVIVSRLAKNADAAGTATQTGNGRLNLERSALDTSTDSIEPAGAAPVGGGGPFVGPYVVAAKLNGQLLGQSNPACGPPAPLPGCPWQTNQLTGWAELQTAPLRLYFAAGQLGNDPQTFTISIDHAAGATAGLESLANFATSGNVTITGGIPGGITFTNGGDNWDYTFTASISDNNEGFVSFNTKLRAGAHAFNGASLQVKGAGTLQFVKPNAAPGTPDLTVTKSGLSAVSPGQTFTYTLQYQNVATGSNSATGVQLTDTLPANATYVTGSCSGSCIYDSVSKTLTWNLGTIPAGSALATQTFQVTVDPTVGSVTNTAQILSAENDATPANNTSIKTSSIVASSISGTVLTDPNGDGIDQGDGTGLAGASVKLVIDSNNNGSYDPGPDALVGGPTLTPATGDWAFTSGLLAGKRYFVLRASPSGYTSTNAIPETVTTDNSTASKVDNDQLTVVFTNATGPFSSNNKFLAKVTNTAPVATAQSVTTNEDTAKTITLSATDADNNNLTFSIVGSPTQGSLGLIGTVTCSGTNPKTCTADVTYTPTANYNGADSFTFKANDGTTDSNTATVSITVTAVNDAPSFTKGADQTVLEDAGAQSVSGWATAISAGPADESGQALNFIVSNDNNGLFSTQPAIAANGTLTYTPTANANGSATVTVQLHDNGGTANSGSDTSASQTFTITVTAVNDAPSFTKGADQTVLEDAGAQSVTNWATAMTTGPGNESGQTLSFFTSNNNNALFSSQPTVSSTGTLSYTPAANASGSATVSVTLSDNGGNANGGIDSVTQTFTITVTPVNDPPLADDETVSTVEDTSVDTPVSTLLAGDTDVDSSTLTVTGVSGAVGGTAVLDDNGTPADKTDDFVRFSPAADLCGAAAGGYNYTVSDGAATDVGHVTVNITCVNDPPVNAAPSTAIMGEDGTLTFTNSPLTGLAVSDIDAGSAPIMITLSATNGTVTLGHPNQFGITFHVGDGTADATMTFEGSLAAINAAFDGTAYNPNADYYGSASLTLTSNDQGASGSGGALSDTDAVLITVNAVNDVPSFAKGADQTVDEDSGAHSVSGWATAISKGPANESAQVVDFIVSNNNNGLFTVGGQPAVSSTGTLSYTSAANANGTATVSVQIHDDGGTANGGVDTSTVQTFAITVTAVNDQPTLDKPSNETVNEDAALQTVNLTGIGSGASNESQTLTVTATSSNTALIPNPTILYTSPNATGSLKYTPAADQFGTATITVCVKDNGGIANGGVDTKTQTFTITVNPINDVPSFTKGANQNVSEDSGAHTVAGWATAISKGPANESTQTVNFLVSNDNNSLFTAGGQPTVDSAGTLTYTSAPNANGGAIVTVRIHDSGGTDNGGVDTSAAQTFTITVTPVNDAPTVTNDNASQSRQYSDPIGTVTVTGSDIDSAGSSLTASTQFKKDAGAFGSGLPSGLSLTPDTTGPNSRTWKLAGYANVQAGVYIVRVTVSDGSLSSYTDVTITVTQEDASIFYTGDSIGQTRINMTLQATVRDSASNGYVGTGAEPLGTIGDIQKMWIRFDIYGQASCPGTGTTGLVTSVYAQVADNGNGLSGDGIGTATTVWAATSEGAYCVVARLVDDNVNGVTNVNQWYVAPEDGTVINFYDNTGKFVTGGGWILDPAGGGNGKGNFGFVGRYNKNYQPQGQMVYVFRGTYNGMAASYVIKSNALTALSFTPTIGTGGVETYPIKATLQGKNNISINRASDGVQLWGEGNATFISTVTDSGQSSGIDSDDFALNVTRSDGSQFKFVATTKLKGGNVVVHMK